MDRLSGSLCRVDEDASFQHELAEHEELFLETQRHLGINPRLFQLAELDALYQDDHAALWTFMRPRQRPSFTPTMLHDFAEWQRLIAESFGPGKVPLRYIILGSRVRGAFCYGGDLDLFQQLIRTRDRAALLRYGKRCVEILHRNMNSLDLPVLTVGLAQGAALGGGFEALLSFDMIVAERSATFGLPETLFGLFPGMGAHAFLTRKVGSGMAERLITSGKTYTAQEMYDLGIVQHVVNDGEGLSACQELVKRWDKRHAGLLAARRATKLINPVGLEELNSIVELWADAALELSETDLRMMHRLTRAQVKVAEAA